MKSTLYAGDSDEQLVSRFLLGNRECLGTLYSRYYTKVFARCYSFARNGDDAFDMTQDVLLKAFGNLDSFAGQSRFSTWLFAITTNYCITRSARKSKRYHEDLGKAHHLVAESMDEEDHEKRIQWETLERDLDAYLSLLPEEERQLLVLKYRMNYSVKDLQKEFNLTASAVKMRLSRARMKMGRIICPQEAA
jgi:RNA polymerase sigma factor (sigma-70 family)